MVFLFSIFTFPFYSYLLTKGVILVLLLILSPRVMPIYQLVEKLRCILSLPNLFPSLARRFACCQSCSVSLRTLWAYGFDSSAPRAPEKSKVGEKEKYFIPFNQFYFLKNRLRSAECHQDWRKPP